MPSNPNKDLPKFAAWIEKQHSGRFFDSYVHVGEIIRIVIGIKKMNMTPEKIISYMKQVYADTGTMHYKDCYYKKKRRKNDAKDNI